VFSFAPATAVVLLFILYAAWFCAMKADLFFPVRGRISIEI
jgi:hypothetical protein